MKKFTAVFLALTLVLLVAGCASNDTGLIGSWALEDSTTEILVITADTLTLGSIAYEYEATKGAGKYWLSGLSLIKLPLTYTLSADGKSLTLVMSSISIKYTKL